MGRKVTAMTNVTTTVRFNVTATFYKGPDHWMAVTVETGLVTYGKTQDEAEALNREANIMLVRSWKRRGMNALDGFMKKHAIVYHVPDERTPTPQGRRELPLAA